MSMALSSASAATLQPSSSSLISSSSFSTNFWSDLFPFLWTLSLDPDESLRMRRLDFTLSLAVSDACFISMAMVFNLQHTW